MRFARSSQDRSRRPSQIVNRARTAFGQGPMYRAALLRTVACGLPLDRAGRPHRRSAQGRKSRTLLVRVVRVSQADVFDSNQ